MKIRRGRQNDPGRGTTVLLAVRIADRMANRNRPAHRKVPQGLLWSHRRQNGSNTSMDQLAFQLSIGTPGLVPCCSSQEGDGDLASYLVRGGWIVVAIDLRAEHPCDVLDDQVCDSMMKDIKNGEYDALGVATPCETFSPLREHPPGPRVLRTKEFPLGLLDKKFGLTKEEVNQVKQANSLIGISQEAIEGMLDLSRPFWWENPDHGDDKVHMWSTPMAQTILDKDRVYMAALDQCVFGAETTKPTIFAFGHLNLSGIDDKR